MLKVEKLILKANKLNAASNLGLILAFIAYKETDSKYMLYCDLWGGEPGEGTKRLTSYHDTKEQCHEEIRRIEGMYSPKYDTIPIIDTTGLKE